jgi:CRP-like cAMP-binding protein
MTSALAVSSGPGKPRGTWWPSRTLLGDMGEPARPDLLRIGTLRRYPSGHRILTLGERSNHLILIVAGSVRVTARAPGGAEVLLAIRIGGDLVGEMAGLVDEPRSADVTTAVSTDVREISLREFGEFQRRHPQATYDLQRALAAKLRFATRRQVDFGGYSVAARVSRVLVDLAVDYGEPGPDESTVIDLRLRQPDLAAMVGASPRPVERALSELRADAILQTRYRKIVIIDMPELARRADVDPGGISGA